jgi:hypothetical protein
MPARKRKITDAEQPLFLDSINLMDFPVNHKLPLIEILTSRYNKSARRLNLKVKLSDFDKYVNIYLKVNGEKRDMFCQVYPGIYSFNLTLLQKENILELFYTTTTSRSGTVFSFYNEGIEK